MQRSLSPASSCCTASERDSSDWEVWAFKAELHLRSGERCLRTEVCAAKLSVLTLFGYLHQSRLKNLRSTIDKWHWRSSVKVFSRQTGLFIAALLTSGAALSPLGDHGMHGTEPTFPR